MNETLVIVVEQEKKIKQQKKNMCMLNDLKTI